MKSDKIKDIIITILIIIIIALSIVLLAITIIKDDSNNETKIKDNNTTNEYQNYEENGAKYTFSKQDNYVSTINEEDLKISIKDPTVGLQLYILDNNKLYYQVGNNVDFNNNDINKMTLYDGLNNIKRIKLTNLTTGVDYSLFLITEDGLVFNLRYDQNKNEFDLKQMIEFSKYKIDDIENYTFTTIGTTYKCILQDGTILEKSIIN